MTIPIFAIMDRLSFIPVILVLLLLVTPVAGAEWLTRDNFVDPPVIEVNDETYIPDITSITFYPGDFVKIRYIIQPKSDADAKLIDDRYYYILTSLENANISIDLRYKNGAATLDIEEFSLKVPDADSLDGIASIEIELTGYIPSITSKLEEKAIMWIKVQDAEDNVLPPVTVTIKSTTLTKDNFAEPIIKVNDRVYIPSETIITVNPGDKVKIEYKIEPKSDADAKLIDNRYYYVLTSLEDAKVSIDIRYRNGVATLDIEDFSLHVPDADSLGGISSIEIELSGFVPYVTEEKEIKLMWIKVQDAEEDVLPPVMATVKPEISPKMSVSPRSFEADVYQDSYTKFEIVIAETSGISPLKDVHLYVTNYAIPIYPPVNPLPPE